MSNSPSPSKKKRRTTKGNNVKAEVLICALREIISETKESKSPLPISQQLAAKNIHCPILLLGEHHIRIKRIIDWMRSKLFEAKGGSVSTYFGSDFSSEKHASHLSEAICCPSLFSSEEMLVLYDADKVKAAPATKILEALKRRNDSALLVLVAPKPNQRAQLLSKLPNSTTVLFENPSPRLVSTWIQSEVKRFGAKGITAEALKMLQNSYGNDLDALSKEIGKLCLLCKPEATIDPAMVKTLTLRSPEVRSFALVEQMAKGNTAQACALTQSLLAQGLHPLQLNAFLSRAIRMLLANREREDLDSLIDNPIPSELSNAWFLKNLGAAKRGFSTPDLKNAINVLALLDFQLKDSALPHELSMGVAVQRITSRQTQYHSPNAR